MKAVKTSSIPSVFVSVCIEPTSHKVSDGRTVEDYSVRRWAAHIRTGDTITRQTSESVTAFWNMIRRLCIKRRNVWIVTPHVTTTFQAMGGWILSEQGNITWGSLTDRRQKSERPTGDERAADRCTMILSPAVSILTHRFHLGRCTWVSLANYTSASIPSIAESVGMECRYDTDFGPSGHGWTLDAKTSAVAMGEFFHRWQRRWIDTDSGHWSATAAMLSHQTFRRRFYGSDLVEHRESECARIERAAIYTGRAEVLYFGRVGPSSAAWEDWPSSLMPSNPSRMSGPVYHYDIRSQYPAIMRDNIFPVCLDREFRSISIDRLKALITYRCVVADVTIKTDLPMYPYREHVRERTTTGYIDGKKRIQTDYIPTRVTYPLGTFRTSLYGPELSAAVSRGHVVNVHGGWEYRPGRPFQKYADWLIRERKAARKRGDATAEITIKLLSNAFAGKFASRSGGWRTVTNVIPQKRWGEWYEIGIDDDEATSYRAIAGVVQRYERPTDEPKGYPAIFGYLTSYGRMQLWDAVTIAGYGNVVWMNTDGLIVNEFGKANLDNSAMVADDAAGKLTCKNTIEKFAAWSPSHYYADGEWTLAGFQQYIRFNDDGKYMEIQAPSIFDLCASHDHDTARYRWVAREMPARPDGQSIGPTGRMVRRQIGNGEPIYQADAQPAADHLFDFGG